MRRDLFVPGLLLAVSVLLAAPAAGSAGQSPPAEKPPQGDEVVELRRELASLREQYEGRIAALESRLQALESSRPAAATPEATPPATPAAVPEQTPAPSTLPVYGGAAASSKVFNPDIAVIGDFLGAAGKNDGRRPAVARAARGGGLASRPSSIPTPAPTSSSSSARRGRASRRASSPSPRCPAACC